MDSDEEFFDADDGEGNNYEYLETTQLFGESILTHHKHKKCTEFSSFLMVKEIILPFQSTTWTISFNPSGDHVAIGGNQKTILVYELNEKNILINPLYLNEHNYDITSLCWSDHNTLLSSSLDHTIKEWRLHAESINTFTFNCKVVTCLYLPQDNNFFIAAFEDYVIRTVHIPSKQVLNHLQLFQDIYSMAISSSGEIVAVGMDKGKVIPFKIRESDLKLVDKPIIKSKNRKGLLKKGKKVSGLWFINNDELVVTTLDSNIRLFSLVDYQMKQKYKGSVIKNKELHAQVTYDGKYTISGSERGKFLIWNTTSDSPKNSKYESIKTRKKKTPEFTFIGPPASLKKLCKGKSNYNYLIFSVDSFNSLKVYIC